MHEDVRLIDEGQDCERHDLDPEFIGAEDVYPFGKETLFGRRIFGKMPSCRRVIENKDAREKDKDDEDGDARAAVIFPRIVAYGFGVARTVCRHHRDAGLHGGNEKLIEEKYAQKAQDIEAEAFCFLPQERDGFAECHGCGTSLSVFMNIVA